MWAAQRANDHVEAMQLANENDIFADFLAPPPTRRLSPTERWNAELELFREIARPQPSTCPLQWWNLHEQQLPGLGIVCEFILIMVSLSKLTLRFFSHLLASLAKRYLAVPASQASCERLFSIAKNDITEKRTSLNPDLVEALLFVSQASEILAERAQNDGRQIS